MLTVPAYEADSTDRFLHLALWDVYAALNGDDGDEEIELNEDNCAVMKELVSEIAKDAGYATKQTYRFRTETNVGDWLRDEKKHSPYVDLVAIERALDFDWEVIRNLTDEERYVFYRRLAADRMWEAPAQGQRSNDKMTGRQRRWTEGTAAERAAVTAGTGNQANPRPARRTHCLGCKEPLHFSRKTPPPAGHARHQGRNLCVMCHKREERRP